MNDEPFYFMLPRLLDSGLLNDDRIEYALVSYPRLIISEASRIIVKDYGNRIDSIDTSNKKRIKCIMENLAVALSLPIKDVSVMQTARTIYKNWMNSTSMFGDNKRQNKYIQRIFKHLSQPFEMRQPDDDEIFKGSFHTLLNNIISDYKYAHTKFGHIFDKDTWITLFNIMLGISDALLEYNLVEKLPKSDSAKLRQKSIDTCFSIIQLSGLDDQDVWKRLKDYCYKWSKSHDFIKVWGHSIEMLFVYMNIKIYQQDVATNVFKEGIYSEDNPISEKMVKLIFFNFLYLVDIKQLISNHQRSNSSRSSCPSILKEFALTMSRLTMNAELISNTPDTLLSHKYSANAFLKLFGPFLIFIPNNADEHYDDAIAVIIDSILSIVSNFNIDYEGETVKQLIAFCALRAVPFHMPIVAAFLKRSSQLYRHNTVILPYISELALQLIPQLDTTKSTRILIGDSFLSSVNSLFMSAVETLKKNDYSKYSPQVNESFEMIWKTTALFPIRFQLLCFAHSLEEVKILEKLAFIFNESNFKQVSADFTNIPFIASCILFIGVYVRFKPNESQKINELHLIKLILTDIMKTDPRRLEEFDLLVIAIQQMVINGIEFGKDLFTNQENIKVICDFISFLKLQLIASDKEKAKRGSSALWLEKYENEIIALNETICALITTNFPSKDLFSRRLNSCFEINESRVIEHFQIQNPKISYFSIGDKSLISFIEPDNYSDITSNEINNQPLILFVRGECGKSIFVVKENYKSDTFNPILSNEIQPMNLPSASEFARTPINNQFFQVQLAPHMSFDELKGIDERTTSMYKNDFQSWLDWNKFGFYALFNTSSPYQRPRVADFISTMGLLRDKNKAGVRVYHNSNEKLKKVIQKLDAIDSIPLLPVVVYHILSSDTKNRQGEVIFDEEKSHTRMTPAFLQFLREIGEPMKISSELNILPPLRTTIPIIPSMDSFIAILSPSMASDTDGAKVIFDFGQTSAMKIIFNETSFDINFQAEKKPKQHVLCVSPKGNGLYHVTQMFIPRYIYSPFAEEQTISAEVLAFNIAMSFEQTIKTNSSLLPSICEKRRAEIRSLFTGEPEQSLTGTIAEQF
ncbi:hypothetical protein TRFO_15994 [Tritrichomonas foetus]|uniref:Ral GTPase-activating protein subunit alpha/beta N-terminal domain-containing protein n=1 Tax=Tritrichomonas foetus TaxID=1144522 RepID=A0A1J4KSB7_9EUKA|nr:hypothetical protein TRFO_15994 [Tritrichomonas foetus]|eukprot:OHT13776.1 hypothetical protein TRFO_15994 [Tritrichomonas foetus]